MKLAFRVDASLLIGAGHVVRCAALARVLASRGAEIFFLCREMPGNYCDWLEQQGFDVTRLQGNIININDDIAQCRSVFANLGLIDWLIVDHYELDVQWETALRSTTRNIFVIDDNADRAHDCDLLLNQNFSFELADRYADLLPTDTKCLIGPHYALLRSEFAVTRAGLSRPPRDGSVKTVLVCFGGNDTQGYTAATLHALRSYAPRLDRIDVVVGPANQNRAAIAAAAAEISCTVLHCPADNMATLLVGTDLAIGAGGTMNWERACLGVPTLAFGIADNQRPILDNLLEAGYLAGAAEMTIPNPELIENWLSVLLDNAPFLQGLSVRSATLVDGLGTQRVANRLLSTMLTFRPATCGDCADLLRWRNDLSIRAISLDSGDIDAIAHATWLKRTLADPQRLLLIAENNNQVAGVVRFDLAPPLATISVYRVPAADQNHYGGLIRQASDWLHRHRPEISNIVAEVLPNNGASLAAFQAAGYQSEKITLVINLDQS